MAFTLMTGTSDLLHTGQFCGQIASYSSIQSFSKCYFRADSLICQWAAASLACICESGGNPFLTPVSQVDDACKKPVSLRKLLELLCRLHPVDTSRGVACFWCQDCQMLWSSKFPQLFLSLRYDGLAWIVGVWGRLVGRNRLGLDADNTPSSNINQALHNPAHHIAMKERSYKTCSMITSGNHDTYLPVSSAVCCRPRFAALTSSPNSTLAQFFSSEKMSRRRLAKRFRLAKA